MFQDEKIFVILNKFVEYSKTGKRKSQDSRRLDCECTTVDAGYIQLEREILYDSRKYDIREVYCRGRKSNGTKYFVRDRQLYEMNDYDLS